MPPQTNTPEPPNEPISPISGDIVDIPEIKQLPYKHMLQIIAFLVAILASTLAYSLWHHNRSPAELIGTSTTGKIGSKSQATNQSVAFSGRPASSQCFSLQIPNDFPALSDSSGACNLSYTKQTEAADVTISVSAHTKDAELKDIPAGTTTDTVKLLGKSVKRYTYQDKQANNQVIEYSQTYDPIPLKTPGPNKETALTIDFDIISNSDTPLSATQINDLKTLANQVLTTLKVN